MHNFLGERCTPPSPFGRGFPQGERRNVYERLSISHAGPERSPVSLHRDTQLSGFLTLPKSLLCWGLSPGALLVYGLLLDRGKLSQRSGWTDKQGWVYVIFPVRELALALGRGLPPSSGGCGSWRSGS